MFEMSINTLLASSIQILLKLLNLNLGHSYMYGMNRKGHIASTCLVISDNII